MPRRAPPVRNRLAELLRRHGVSQGELARRTFLSVRLLARLRARDANPGLATAERIAAALAVPVERIWWLPSRRGGRGRRTRQS
jgi:transcriptional regulator with XRE-family HTH domain